MLSKTLTSSLESKPYVLRDWYTVSKESEYIFSRHDNQFAAGNCGPHHQTSMHKRFELGSYIDRGAFHEIMIQTYFVNSYDKLFWKKHNFETSSKNLRKI